MSPVVVSVAVGFIEKVFMEATDELSCNSGKATADVANVVEVSSGLITVSSATRDGS